METDFAYLPVQNQDAPYIQQYWVILAGRLQKQAQDMMMRMVQLLANMPSLSASEMEAVVTKLQDEADEIFFQMNKVLTPWVKSSFNHHDRDRDGLLSPDEAAMFFANFVKEAAAAQQALLHFRTHACLFEVLQRYCQGKGGEFEAISQMLGDENTPLDLELELTSGGGNRLAPLHVEMCGIQGTVEEKAEAMIQKVCDTIDVHVQSALAAYEKNKAECDIAAFGLLDVGGDGGIDFDELLAGLQVGSDIFQEFNEALGFQAVGFTGAEARARARRRRREEREEHRRRGSSERNRRQPSGGEASGRAGGSRPSGIGGSGSSSGRVVREFGVKVGFAMLKKMLTAPFSRVKLVLQAQGAHRMVGIQQPTEFEYKGIVECVQILYLDGGISSLWLGASCNCLRHIVAFAFDHIFRDSFKRLYSKFDPQTAPRVWTVVEIMCTTFHRASSLLLEHPLEFAHCVLANRFCFPWCSPPDLKSQGPFRVITTIANGPGGGISLYTGYGVAIFGFVAGTCASKACWDRLDSCRILRGFFGNSFCKFLAVQSSILCGSFCSYPFDTVSHHLMLQAVSFSDQPSTGSVLTCFRCFLNLLIYEPAAFWKGFVANALAVVIGDSVLYVLIP